MADWATVKEPNYLLVDNSQLTYDGNTFFNSWSKGISRNIKEENMKSLFNVCMVDKAGNVLLDIKVVAKNREEALFIARVAETLKVMGMEYSDVTVISFLLGEVKTGEKE